MKFPLRKFNIISGKSFKSSDGIRRLIRNIIIAGFLALIINVFFLDTTKVTSESMEDTILAGDFLFVEKLSFGAKFPASFPMLDFILPDFRMPGISSIERGDVLLFESPVKSFLPELYDERNFVKRCVALPGDTVQIKNRIVIVNNVTIPFSSEVKFTPPNQGKYYKLFAPDSKWTIDNYGPIAIPEKGIKVELNETSLSLYKKIINEESFPDTVRVEDNTCYLGDKQITEYTFCQNYYFVLGDNRNRSSDSRFWGFLSEEKILGRVLLVYISIDFYDQENESTFWERVRWNRIAKLIK